MSEKPLVTKAKNGPRLPTRGPFGSNPCGEAGKSERQQTLLDDPLDQQHFVAALLQRLGVGDGRFGGRAGGGGVELLANQCGLGGRRPPRLGGDPPEDYPCLLDSAAARAQRQGHARQGEIPGARQRSFTLCSRALFRVGSPAFYGAPTVLLVSDRSRVTSSNLNKAILLQTSPSLSDREICSD
jgi:hypothetical protein